MKHRLRAFALGLAVTLGAATAHAQPAPLPAPSGARSGTSAASQAHDDDGAVDKARTWAKDSQIVERLKGDVDGWYPRLGGMTRGSGFSLGPGYRFHVFDDQVLVDLSAALSTRLYKAVDARVRWLSLGDERLEVWTDYRFEDFTEEDFFGIGGDSRLDTRTNYGFRSSDVTARVHAKLRPWLRVGGNAGVMHPRIGRGHDREWPSTEVLFTDAAVPGLVEQPNFLHTTVFSEVDYRDAPGNPRSGGFYRASLGRWDDRSLDAYDFHRVDLTLTQHVPVTAARTHVVSARLGASHVNHTPGDRVPFYVLPYVGGTDTVRSYREFRFKDQNTLWFGGEYQWIPIQWVSGVVFADFGTVARDWQDLGASPLKRGYGVGFRAHSATQTFLRMDFGFGGDEGMRIFFKLGPSF